MHTVKHHSGARRLGSALTIAALFVVGCSDDDRTDSVATTTTAAPTTLVETTIPTAALTGTWRTRPISIADAEAILSAGGLGEWVDEFRTRAPFGDETTLVLEIGEEWDLFGESPDGSRAEIDYDASFQVDGDEVEVIHFGGSNTFRWQIDGDTLTLEHLSTTMPAFEGIPEEVFQRALYTTAEFTRDG